MSCLLGKALSKTGINRIWPMVRDIIMINPVDKWSCVTLVPYGDNVIDMIRAILPHAKSSHFKAVRVNDQPVVPQSIPPGHGSLMIAFLPVFAECVVKLKDGCIIKCTVDVTTTIKDLKTQIHIKSGLCTDVMTVIHGETKLQDWDYVCHCGSPELLLVVNPRVQIPKDIPVAKSQMQLSMPPTHSDVMVPATVQMIRFAIRHPVWSTVRTVACPTSDSIEAMLKKLLPDLSSTCSLSLKSNGSENMNDLHVKHLNMANEYEVVFGCSKSYPVARLEVVPCISVEDQMSIGAPSTIAFEGMVKIWVRSPFQTKPYEKHFPGEMTAQYLAGVYFAHSQSSQCVMVMLDGKLIDPRIKIKMIDGSKVLTFRAAPLLGGGKDKEKDKDVKKILADQFLARGVPEESIGSRIDGFLAKISADKVRTHSGETWAKQWVSIKGLANEARFRLITTEELRAFQTKKKSDRPHDGASTVSTKSSAGTSISQRANVDPSGKKLNLTEIRLDLSYFKGGDTSLKQLPSESFGPDGCGITIMHVDSAQKFLPVKRLSADPLAIVAIGSKSITNQSIRMAPAMNAKNEPILVPFTILNYGDTEVTFHAGNIKAELVTQTAMVVEFTIMRDEVEKWEDARSALVYLGQKIGETKTSKVLSSWAVKPYTKDRKQCEHQVASYIHGYLRVLESQADPLLARSGWSGIYLVPKNGLKKPHESYSIVAVPNKSIDEMKAIVQSTKNALGIVRTANALAVRCRREHAYTIKKVIFPELPLQEEGSFEAGDRLFVLKHLEAHTNTSELTSALHALGWKEAKALKPLGPTSWSIASPTCPPAAHVCLNNSFVVILPQGQTNNSVSFGVKVPPTAAFVADAGGDITMESTSNTSTRLDELKQDLHGQVQAMVEAKFQESKQEIGCLKQSIGQAKESIEQIKGAQIHLEKKVQQVETTVKTNGEGLLKQLTNMFGDLQSNINSRLDKLETRNADKENEPKRAKLEDEFWLGSGCFVALICAIVTLMSCEGFSFLTFVLVAGFLPLFSLVRGRFTQNYSSRAIVQARWICKRRHKFNKLGTQRPLCKKFSECNCKSLCKNPDRIWRSCNNGQIRFKSCNHPCTSRCQGVWDWNLKWKGRGCCSEYTSFVPLHPGMEVGERSQGIRSIFDSSYNGFQLFTLISWYTKICACVRVCIHIVYCLTRPAIWISCMVWACSKNKAYSLGWISNSPKLSVWKCVVLTATASIIPLSAICVCHCVHGCVDKAAYPQTYRPSRVIRHSGSQKKLLSRWSWMFAKRWYRCCTLIHICFLYFGTMLSKIIPKNSWKLWMILLYLKCVPIGEAQNPGPMWFHDQPCQKDILWVGNANPTQLLNKESCLSEWGTGVWTFSETSATDKAMISIRNRAAIQGFNIQFGAPVPPQQKNTIMTGKAGGVAVATNFPIRSFAYPMPEFLHQSTRFMDCVVQIGNGHSIYVSTIYGVAGQSSAHHQSLTIDIVNQATERALSYKGPAVICGDFNVPLESLDSWDNSQKSWLVWCSTSWLYPLPKGSSIYFKTW